MLQFESHTQTKEYLSESETCFSCTQLLIYLLAASALFTARLDLRCYSSSLGSCTDSEVNRRRKTAKENLVEAIEGLYIDIDRIYKGIEKEATDLAAAYALLGLLRRQL